MGAGKGRKTIPGLCQPHWVCSTNQREKNSQRSVIDVAWLGGEDGGSW
jgi:hypothetical protein